MVGWPLSRAKDIASVKRRALPLGAWRQLIRTKGAVEDLSSADPADGALPDSDLVALTVELAKNQLRPAKNWLIPNNNITFISAGKLMAVNPRHSDLYKTSILPR